MSPRLLTAGKRLASLYEFYEAAKEVTETWKPQDDFIVVGDAMLKERASLLIVSKTKLKLSRIEATIFKLLLENAGRPVSPLKMSSCPGGPNEWFARAHISALRKKLGKRLRKRVVTVKGEGYMYETTGHWLREVP